MRRARKGKKKEENEERQMSVGEAKDRVRNKEMEGKGDVIKNHKGFHWVKERLYHAREKLSLLGICELAEWGQCS